MGRLHSPFPIDLVLADQLFPVMETAAKNLEHIPQLYEELDGFFWRNFLDLFTGPDDPPIRDSIWATMFRLRGEAELGNNLTGPLLRLTLNTDKITAACATLGLILKR